MSRAEDVYLSYHREKEGGGSALAQAGSIKLAIKHW